jgi:5'-methylthioinosine phosphorylase
MPSIGIIGGTGLNHWGEPLGIHQPGGCYGEPSAVLQEYLVNGVRVLFLPRHGVGHRIPPHAVNYRANIDLFKQSQVDGIIAVNAVGGISSANAPGTLTLPDQLIDYSWGRAHTYSMSADDELLHIDFAAPFSGPLRTCLLHAAALSKVEITNGGCLAVTQGPRLETAAEIQKYKRDGCDMVGMTSMPEAALAREAGLDYASLCVNANWAAGLEEEAITMQAVHQVLEAAMINVRKLLQALFEELPRAR